MDRTRPESAPGGPAATLVRSGWARAWNRPLRHHVIGLVVVVLALTPLLGGRGLFFSDEGAAMAQAQLLADGRGWSLDVPRPDLDPEGAIRPLDLSDEVTGAPLPKHPIYPVLLVPFVAMAGTFGAKLLSVIGLVMAATSAALIARRLKPELDRPVLWAAGLASPLFFDAWLVVAHTLGAACCGFAALAAVNALERCRWRSLFALGALLAAAVLLRNEAVLFGAAMFVGGVVVAVRQRSSRGAVVGLAALVGAGAGYAVDTVLTGIVASPEGPFRIGETLQSSNFLSGRLVSTLQTTVMPEHGVPGLGGLVLVVALMSAVGAAVTVRERPDAHRRIAVLSVLAVAAVLLRHLMAPEAIPGLFVAFPALAVGLLLVPRQALRRPSVLFLAATSVVFIGGVLATQYQRGGGTEWGFRYAAAGLPVMIPLAALGIADAARRLDRQLRVALLVGLVVLSGSLTALALRVLDQQHRLSIDAVAVVEDVRAQSDRPVVVMSYLPLGRIAWAEILAGEDWTLTEEEGEMEDLAARLVEDGGDVVLVTLDPDTELELFEDTHEVILQVPAVPSGRLEVLRLVPR